VETSLGITKEDIGQKISITDFNNKCKSDVMTYTREWEDLTMKMGYWVDMENPYITYDNRYIETLWWLLKELFSKGCYKATLPALFTGRGPFDTQAEPAGFTAMKGYHLCGTVRVIRNTLPNYFRTCWHGVFPGLDDNP
jgi:hypothetical protein